MSNLACSAKRPTETAYGAGAVPTAKEEEGREQAVESAQERIKRWLGEELTQKVSELGKELGKNLGLKLAEDPAVIDKAEKLTQKVLKHKEVKKRLGKISDKATEGFAKKLTLGWKALTAGGVDAYKKKVKESTQKVAVEVLAVYLREGVLKDDRTAGLLKGFGPALKVQGKVTAVAVEENLSPVVSKKILGTALSIAAAGDRSDVAQRVDEWVASCQDPTQTEVERLMKGVGDLESVEEALRGLAIEVLEHERTKAALVDMAVKLIDDKEVNKVLVKVYEAAAFEKGDDIVKRRFEDVLSLTVVDTELFAAIERLAGAGGSAAMINRHAASVSQDPELAKLIERFIVNIFETCGDPTAAGV